jgi:hypothetical protein
MAVGVKEGQDFQAEAAKPLFVIRRPDPISSTDLYSYDVSSDGQRFLVNADASDVGPPNLTLDLNWTANLGR